MRNIVVEDLHSTPVSEHKVEVVERKGIGHPDSICDAIMNEVSNELSKEYLKKFGAVLHHNIDKSLLAAGETQQKFGGGRIIYPMLLIFGDRATFEDGGETVAVSDIAIKTAKDWIRKNLRFVDPDRNLKYQIELRRGSAALNDIFKRKTDMFVANDTSAAVGYAPFTQTESIVMETENFLNSKQFKKRFPESGEDVKIMALRIKDDLHLTVAMPLIDRFVESEQDYFRKKDVILEEIKNFVKNKADIKTDVFINTLDVKGRGLGGIYLTVTGICAEDADSGEVGRGNRVNGLIPLNRPVSNEAAAGKNPVSHVGKIYNVLSHKIANEVYNAVPDIKEIYIWLLSQIGRPIDQPDVAAAQVIMNSGSLDSVKKDVHEVIDKELANIKQFCTDLINGKYKVC